MTELQKWDAIYEDLKASYSEGMFNILFLEAQPIFLDSTKIVLQVNDMSYNFLEDRETKNFLKFQMICKMHLHNDVQISFVASGAQSPVVNIKSTGQELISDTSNIDINDIVKTAEASSSFLQEIRKEELLEPINQNIDVANHGLNPNQILSFDARNGGTYQTTGLRRNFSFDNFFYSHENKKVVKACSVLIDSIDDPKFNPLFLYGQSGIGKTHLVNAIGNKLYENNPNLKILFTDQSKFMVEYTDMFKGGLTNLDATDIFKEKYYNLDVLIFDDIQMLERKEATLAEFFSIFERLITSAKLVIITSDKKPEELKFEQRLITRFLSGLTLQLRVPDSDTKKQIFDYHVTREGFKIDEEAIQIFIDNSYHVRALLGYINAMKVHSINNESDDEVFTEEYALEIVHGQQSSSSTFTAKQIVSIICNHFNTTEEEMKSSSRKAHIVHARQFTAYFLNTKLKMNYETIALYIGVKRHSSSLRSVRRVEKEKERSPYKEHYEKLMVVFSNK